MDDEVVEEVKKTLTPEQEKALKKKEKDRRRREAMKSHSIRSVDGALPDVAEGGGGEGGEEVNAKNERKAIDKGNLRKRLTDLFRGGCAGEVFAESSYLLGGKRAVLPSTDQDPLADNAIAKEIEEAEMENGEGHRRSRICLSLCTGLQILEVPSSPDVVRTSYTYLLAGIQDTTLSLLHRTRRPWETLSCDSSQWRTTTC